jgi:ribosome maturation factor RimP
VAPAFLFRRGEQMVARRFPQVDAELDGRVEAMGFELVEASWGGSSGRPILRLRVDRPDSVRGDGVTVADCARVSRALEAWLDELEGLPERYVLEVSSPGVERPLSKLKDWERFAGEEVSLKGKVSLLGRGVRLQGVLLGWEKGPEGPRVRLRLKDGEEVSIERNAIAEARLVYRWE